GHDLLPFWRGGNAVTLEDIPDRLVTDGIAQVGQSTHNAIIAPGAILAGHPHHEVFDLLVHARTADSLMHLGRLTLLVRERAVPGEDGIGRGNRRDLLECFPTQLLTQLSEGVTVTITQRHATRDLLAEDAVLCCEVCVTEPEFFGDRFAKRSQQLLPVHRSLTPAKTASRDAQYGQKGEEMQGEACIIAKAQLIIAQRVWIF